MRHPRLCSSLKPPLRSSTQLHRSTVRRAEPNPSFKPSPNSVPRRPASAGPAAHHALAGQRHAVGAGLTRTLGVTIKIMPYSATVIPVMIASPGDVSTYRSHTRNVLLEWNYIHAQATGVILMPVGWETHSSPELGSTAQDLINDRVLEDCDLLVGIFWTRLGTPTGKSSSGSVEEIHRHVEAGRPAMVYFCEAPAAQQMFDSAQYSSLQDFRRWCQTQGLVETFLNAEDFQAKFTRHLQIALHKNSYLRQLFGANASGGIELAKPPDRETELLTKSKTLSPEARKLLIAATEDQNGTIFLVDYLSGRIIQAGNLDVGEGAAPRELAKWEYGLDQLRTLLLVKDLASSAKGEQVFEVTHDGYTLADAIKSAQ